MKMMPVVKKLIFALPFLLSFGWFTLQVDPFFKNPNLIFSLDITVLFQFLFLIMAALSSSLFFVLLVTLAFDWKIILPVAILSSALPTLVVSSSPNYILTAGFLLSFGLIFLLLSRTLATYITFNSSVLLTPPVKQLTTLLLLTISVGFYFSADAEITKNGFTLPDSLMESTLKMIPMPNISGDLEGIEQLSLPSVGTGQVGPLNNDSASLPQLSKEQIETLRQNPEVLKKNGIDPSMLDYLESTGYVKGLSITEQTAKPSPANPFKSLIQSQLQTILKPYLEFIAPVLAVLFFFTLRAFASIFSIPLPGIVWFIFYILEKTGFTTYTKETREVKKLVV